MPVALVQRRSYRIHSLPSTSVEGKKRGYSMKARTLTRVLGVILPAALVITSPVFAHDPDYDGRHVDHDYSYGGHVDHDYSYGGHVDHEYGTSWYGNRDYYGGYQGRGYARSPYHG